VEDGSSIGRPPRVTLPFALPANAALADDPDGFELGVEEQAALRVSVCPAWAPCRRRRRRFPVPRRARTATCYSATRNSGSQVDRHRRVQPAFFDQQWRFVPGVGTNEFLFNAA